MPEAKPIQPLELDAIRIDGTQTRAALDEATVAEYAECYRNRAKMPPLVVFFDGSEHWLAEGFHRYFALRKIKHDKPVRCDVREGTRRDAIQYGFTANVAHGLRRTNADKRHAVEMALSDPEWENWSDHAVAELCGVDHKTVAKVRSERVTTGELPQLTDAQEPTDSGVSETPQPETRVGRDGKKRPAKQPKTPPKSEPVTEEAGGTDAPPAEVPQRKSGQERVGTKDRKDAAKALGVLIRALDKIGVGLDMAEHTRAIDKAIREA
jgi:hypothetical protein